jgi:hypothetical protein
MTFDKVKISFLMAILVVSLGSVIISQSFAEDNKQMNVFSNSAKLGQKIPIQGYDRIISETDPGLGHEQHQLAVIIPISENEYSGTLFYSASEPVQLVALKGPLGPGEEKGKSIWTPDGEIFYELVQVNEYSTSGKWNFVGNALAVHTYKTTPFIVDYKLDYDKVTEPGIKPMNHVNDITIMAEFNFDSETVQIPTFDVFKQISGFNREQPQVNLQGVVGIEKSILYRAADTQYNKGTGPYAPEHQFSEFGMSIYLEKGDLPIRKITYRECDITNYTIDTLYDNDYSYNKASVFVLVDNFEITCAGMQPYHYDYQKYIDEYGLEDVMKMKNMEMSPKTFKDYNLDG